MHIHSHFHVCKEKHKHSSKYLFCAPIKKEVQTGLIVYMGSWELFLFSLTQILSTFTSISNSYRHCIVSVITNGNGKWKLGNWTWCLISLIWCAGVMAPALREEPRNTPIMKIMNLTLALVELSWRSQSSTWFSARDIKRFPSPMGSHNTLQETWERTLTIDDHKCSHVHLHYPVEFIIYITECLNGALAYVLYEECRNGYEVYNN